MKKRASLALSGHSGMSQIANTVSSSAVSKATAANSPVATSLIRHLILTTNPEAYAAACLALAGAPKIDGQNLPCELGIIGGNEDYLAGKEAVEKWAAEISEGRGRAIVLEDVGHWGAIESPDKVGAALKTFLAPS